MTKVSVIVPIYNVEKYLHQCLDSILSQTLEDIEIICVDDGSPDSCGEIIDEYAKKDSRIKPVHQPNGGYGKAVNAGIDIAQGQYVGIIESDDWCEPNMFEKLYNKAQELDADVCKGDFKYYFGNNRYRLNNSLCEVAPENKVFTIKENPLIMRYHVSIWSAIYKKEFLDKNNIRVLETKQASYQDMPFAALVYAKGARITLIHDALLNYRLEEGMNSSTKRTDSRLKLMPVMCMKAKQYFIENNCWDEVKEVAYRHFYNCSFGMWLETDDEFKYAHYQELRKLFNDIPAENIKYKYLKREQKKVLEMILNDDYNGLLKYAKAYKRKEAFRKFRQNIISIRLNKYEKQIVLFGKNILRSM